jgi:hypothetical protein
MQSRHDLGRSFGTKKTKKIIRELEQNLVQVDQISGQVTNQITVLS